MFEQEFPTYQVVLYAVVFVFTIAMFLKIPHLLRESISELDKLIKILNSSDVKKPDDMNSLLKVAVVHGVSLIAIIFFVVLGTMLVEINIMDHEVKSGLIYIIIFLLIAYISTLIVFLQIFHTASIKKENQNEQFKLCNIKNIKKT